MPTASQPFELKGRMTSITVMRVLSDDLNAIRARLTHQISQAPAFFRGAPWALDLSAVEGDHLDLAALVAELRRQGVVPMGLRGGNAAQMSEASALGLGTLDWQQGGGRSAEKAPSDKPAAVVPAQKGPSERTMLVTKPVRSGQQIYARGRDLLITAAVSAGAEVIADGHIHIYGKLRGRALAGAQGDESARIFCASLDAELIAVAGVYRVSEDIEDAARKQPVQAFLHNDEIVFDSMW